MDIFFIVDAHVAHLPCHKILKHDSIRLIADVENLYDAIVFVQLERLHIFSRNVHIDKVFDLFRLFIIILAVI